MDIFSDHTPTVAAPVVEPVATEEAPKRRGRVAKTFEQVVQEVKDAKITDAQKGMLLWLDELGFEDVDTVSFLAGARLAKEWSKSDHAEKYKADKAARIAAAAEQARLEREAHLREVNMAQLQKLADQLGVRIVEEA